MKILKMTPCRDWWTGAVNIGKYLMTVRPGDMTISYVGELCRSREARDMLFIIRTQQYH